MSRKLLRGAAATAAVAAGITAWASAGATASSTDRGGGHVATVEMKANLKKEQLFFKGPKKVEKGTRLQIVNGTDPEQVGPHTFTLIKQSKLPKTKKQIKSCEKLEVKVCLDVAKAHKVNLNTFEVKKHAVEAGKNGWDKSFGKIGDSWYTETAGETTSRRISAKAGTTLYYFCDVHPFMQGKIKVVKK